MKSSTKNRSIIRIEHNARARTIMIPDDIAAVLDVAAERRRVPVGAGRLPPLPGAAQAHQTHALPQRRATPDLQVSQIEM